ncbi:MAG: ABC transporter permease [Verrucomicrobia bacterium]|nr:ABC transporter permease [Verrucomicrobiota bacterium]
MQEHRPTWFSKLPETRAILEAPLPRSYLNFVGTWLLGFIDTVRGLMAFGLIALSVAVTKAGVARRVVRPLIRAQVYRAGVRLLPMITFLGVALGLIIIGQTVSLLTRVGAQGYIGTVMVTVVVREIGPLLTALLVLARVGTATVVELGTARALGEVEALEALAIDPVHYLVVPRMIGLAVSVFALTVYLILVSLLSGYLFAFVQDVPLPPGEYFRQLAAALRWEDFALLALKTIGFGLMLAVVTCFQGLARALRIEEVPQATTRAVVHAVVACVLLDALFIVVYLLI